MTALAQTVPEPIEVPPAGYESTDTITVADTWKYYVVHAEIGQEIYYEFHVVGEGNISVFLSKMEDPLNYYVSFSTPVPVTDFERTFPPDYGFSRDYFIQVNSTSGINVQYSVEIHTQKAPEKNYTLYYALIILGFVGLVAFSYEFVVWQEKREAAGKKGKRRERRRR
jgi:hypothetical protein